MHSAMWKVAVTFDWHKGDVLCIENERVSTCAHAIFPSLVMFRSSLNCFIAGDAWEGELHGTAETSVWVRRPVNMFRGVTCVPRTNHC